MRSGGMFFALCLLATPLWADGPADNMADKVRRIPPPGIKVPDADRTALTAGLQAFEKELKALPAALASNPKLAALLPDVEIYYNAIYGALNYDEFYKEPEIKAAHALLKQGQERAAQLKAGQAPWTTATGLVVRGYRSKIDGSAQPYGLEIPKDFDFSQPHRLDFWFHGRGEDLSELSFIQQRTKSAGQFQPPNTIVLHPYGRYCNANHFAGEIDTLEALAHAQQNYLIDPNRIVVRGFSMGGAACWNFAVHYTDKWVAAAPGAGFSESPDFLKVFQNETVKVPQYEKDLFHLYDCIDWAENLSMLPTVAYSGENDKQKQAADIMAVAMKKEGLDLVHIIGPKMGHSYDPASKVEINRLIDEIAARGRPALPKQIRFTTYTLRYNQMYWIRVDGLEAHWSRGQVAAELDGQQIRIVTKNVSRLSLTFDKSPLPAGEAFKVVIDGQELRSTVGQPGAPLVSSFVKSAAGWAAAPAQLADKTLRKQHLLQGPIDDAFMDRFVMVEPTGKPLNEELGTWTTNERLHAVEHWRRQFRGVPFQKKDTELTDADIASSNLILWGDPSSNAVLKKIAGQLPIQWTADGVQVGEQKYAADQFVPTLIYPNPLNPQKYVVLNSGFTFREYDYLNNARQVPKLPDWAVFDVKQPRTSRHAAGVVKAGFFDETWQLKK